MGSIWGSTKTVKKVDKSVKNIASSLKRAIQRETGNKSGAANGHSKGGNAQKVGSIDGKAGNMAAGDTGKLAGMSGVTENQRPGYKEQMAKVRLEQSKRVTCVAGRMNATVAVLPLALPWLFEGVTLGAKILLD